VQCLASLVVGVGSEAGAKKLNAGRLVEDRSDNIDPRPPPNSAALQSCTKPQS